VADYIREKIWHPTQQLKTLPDDGVALSVQLSSLVEIQRWVLGWGAHARVMEPDILKQQLRQNAEQLVRLYAENSD
jgi:predicted DNA-binding transcriptional regulator YafY